MYGHPLISQENYEQLARAHTRTEIPPGTLLLEIGKTAREFYLIEKGLFRSYLYDYNGNEITTGFYCAHQILIESFSFFQRTPSRENFQAVSEGIAWKIGYDSFQQLLQQIDGLREWGRTWATHQLSVLKQRSIDTLTINATDRYLALIKEQPAIILHAPLKHIATYLGITDSSLSRIRREISSR